MDGSIDFDYGGDVGAHCRSFVFVHSSYRTSSTWLWSKFRQDPKTVCYNELFHEHLKDMSVESATRISTAFWRSNQPPTAPCFLEFLPLIREGGGVQGYDGSFADERFLPPDGMLGDLTSSERTYLASLIRYAHDRALLPVLTCTRSIGRMGAIKRAFGGHHVLAHRNLFHQWGSYSAQFLAGNPYFIATVNNVIRNCRQDGFIRNLDNWFAERKATAFDQKMFSTFILLHLYLYGRAAESADIVFDTSRATVDAEYRSGFSADIAERVGIDLNLSDARGNFEVFVTEIDSIKAFSDELDQFVKIIIAECDTDNGRVLVRNCYDAVLSELERHHFYTRNLRPFLSIPVPVLAEEPACADGGDAPAAIETDADAVIGDAQPAVVQAPEATTIAAPSAPSRFGRLRKFRRLLHRLRAGGDWV